MAAGRFGGIATERRHPAETVIEAVRALGLPMEEYRMMFSSYSWTIEFLDGALVYSARDCGFSGPPRLTLTGNRALRLVCHRLGVVQPRQFEDEDRVPQAAELERQLIAELAARVADPPQ